MTGKCTGGQDDVYLLTFLQDLQLHRKPSHGREDLAVDWQGGFQRRVAEDLDCGWTQGRHHKESRSFDIRDSLWRWVSPAQRGRDEVTDFRPSFRPIVTWYLTTR